MRSHPAQVIEHEAETHVPASLRAVALVLASLGVVVVFLTFLSAGVDIVA